jgi:cytochrome c oxidase assembly protein Cox11
VRNTSDRPITGQAVPSVTPGQAAQHFEKIECFCFSQQTLGPGEAREMPLAFIVKPEVDRNISHITLSYAFFSIDGQRQTLTSAGRPDENQPATPHMRNTTSFRSPACTRSSCRGACSCWPSASSS